MKNTLKRLLALFSSFLIFFFSILPSSVSARISDVDLHDLGFGSTKYYSSFDLPTLYENYNSRMPTFFNDYLFFASNSESTHFLCGLFFSGLRSFQSGSYIYYTNLLTSGLSLNHFTSYSSDYSLSGLTSPNSNDNWIFVFRLDPSFNYYDEGFLSYYQIERSRLSSTDSSYLISNSYSNYSNVLLYRFPNFEDFISFAPEEPDHISSYPTLWGVRVGIEKKDFLDWLRSEGKLSLINSPGFDFVDSQLDTLIDIFDSYGNNPLSFFSSLCKTFNITTDIKAAVSLVQTIQQLYRDYQDYKNSSQLEAIRPSSASHPHWRTDKDDVSLTTDHEDDTTIISILREILRTLIHLPENISVYFNFLNSRFNDISYNFQSEINSLNNLPDQISSLTYNSLINPLTEIKDAINNIDLSSPDVSVDVTISEEKQNEINTFFSDWNVKYSTAINEKIPVISQLSGLFNDEFFEKCGIDINGDGQVYQYYSTSVSYDSSSVSGTSSDSVSETDVVNLLCSQFDNSDPNFLNDVSYSEDVPSLSISIAGKKTEIFDFRLFAKYRTQIHTIMIFCIYSLYFLSLYKSLPSIIGNVSDVSNAFSDYKQSKKE